MGKEQGGKVWSRGSFTWLKPFSNANYGLAMADTNGNYEHGGITSKTNTGVYYYDGKGWQYWVWLYACGF